MNLKEAKQILNENGYELIDEGLFSNIKDKFVNKINNLSEYRKWYDEVVNTLKLRYRITVKELTKFVNSDCFKKCYELGIKPFTFVKGVMKKYVEFVQNPEAVFEKLSTDEMKVYNLISEHYTKSLTEVSDAEMFDRMWDENQLANQFKSGKIKSLDKYQTNKMCNHLRRKCGEIVWKKLRDLKMKPADMDKDGAGDYAAKYILKSEDELRNFFGSNPNTYFTPEILEIIANDWNEDGKEINSEMKNFSDKYNKIKVKKPIKTITPKTNTWFDGEEL